MLSSSSKMGCDQQFDQQLEFRRRDGVIESSSDECGSSFSGEPVLKKHKLVSTLISLEKDETSDTPKSQQKARLDADVGSHFKIGKVNKRQVGPNKKNNAGNNGMGRNPFNVDKKKRKDNAYESAALDDIKIFMESILEELKDARENLIGWMKDEMHKLMADDSTQLSTRTEGNYGQDIVQIRLQNNFESSLRAENCKGQSSKRPAKTEIPVDSSDPHQFLENQVDHGEDVKSLPSTTRRESRYSQEIIQVHVQNSPDSAMKTQSCNGGLLDNSVNIKRATDHNHCNEVFKNEVDHNQVVGSLAFEQVASSMYLTLPTVLPQSHVENHGLDFSCNYVQSGVAEIKMGVNLGTANRVVEASTHCGYISGILQRQKIGSCHMSSRNFGCFDRNGSLPSSIGSEFPLPLRQNLHGSLDVLSQGNLENPSQESNDMLGMRMKGGATRFSGGSHALSEHLVTNNFHSYLNHKSDGGLMAFQTTDFKEGRLFPN